MTTATHDPAHPPLPTLPALDPSPIRKVALGAAVVGLGAWAVLGGINLSSHSSPGGDHGHHGATGVQDFFLTYLVGWVFWAAIPIGSIALMMIGYLVSASWGVVMRRCFQAASRTLPLVAVLFVPIAVSLYLGDAEHGPKSPFWWNDKSYEGDVEAVAKAKHMPPEAIEEIQEKQHGYEKAPIITGLNETSFLTRAAIIFVVYGILVYLLNTISRRAEDQDDASARIRLRQISGPGIIAWALLMTVGVTDWVMSVEPTWASSMFPVVFGMNAFICTFCVSILTIYTLYGGDAQVMGIIKEKFRIDIGSLLLGFTMVWAYASFCQYMLIWAANLPEELTYYRKRGDHGWEYLAYFLMLCHWLLPFIVLLFREVKTNPASMKLMAYLLLTVCAADIVWWIVPALPHPEGGLYVPMAFAAIIGVGGVWGLLFAHELGRRPILPANSETQFLATWGHHH